jgi:hypothetical protein
VFENRALMKVIRPKREEAKEEDKISQSSASYFLCFTKFVRVKIEDG